MEEEENYEQIISKVIEAFNSPEFSDILIRSKNKTFHCLNIILSSREGDWGRLSDLPRVSGHEETWRGGKT